MTNVLLPGLKPEDVSPLWEGEICIDYDPVDRSYRELRYEFQVDNRQFALALGGKGNPIGTMVRRDGQHPQPSSLMEMSVGILSEEDQSTLASYLDGQEVPVPPPLCMAMSSVLAESRPTRSVSTQFGPGTPMVTLPVPMRVALNRHMGMPDNDNGSGNLADIFKWLVLQGIVMALDWQLADAENLSTDIPVTTAHLAARRLALYLFRLKNGNAEQRTMFTTIGQWFNEMAGTSLDVRMNTLALAKDTIEQRVELITGDNVPLRMSGTGRTQLAWLATLVAASSGQVLVLDEPDAHLFPALQRRLAKKIYTSGSQCLIATHSPQLVAGVGLEHVRRLSVTGDGSAVQAIDQASIGELWNQVLPDKRWQHSDDLLFLFARIVVFVEGVHDAAVLDEWFTAWARYRGFSNSDDYAAELEIRWHPAGGKNAIASRAYLAEQLRIPWVALYDADVLAQRPENQAIVDDWYQYGFLSGNAAIQLGTQAGLQKIPEYSDQRIFFCGNALAKNTKKGETPSLESLSVFQKHLTEYPSEIRTDRSTYRSIAATHGITDKGGIDSQLHREFPHLVRFFEHVHSFAQHFSS